jgi:ribosomal-protein-alanine N-acetyltransferase
MTGQTERRAPTAADRRVRPATATDVDEVVAIERAAFSDPWSRSAFAGLLGDNRVLFAVAELPDGAIAGYVVAWFVADEGEIANLAVTAEARRRRLGAALLDEAIRAARERDVTSIYLEVRDSNAAARALYASRGFVEVGRRRRYYRKPVEDALVLRLVLPAPSG